MDCPSGRPYPIYYVHDHLYSPVALTTKAGSVLERYEYDAYGEPTFWSSGFTTESNEPGCQNPYVFTGRRIDILDNGNLKLQYNRNRYYNYSMGRWLTHDPLGINPSGEIKNIFAILSQYRDSMSLYEYVKSNPVMNLDPEGLKSACQGGIHEWGFWVIKEDGTPGFLTIFYYSLPQPGGACVCTDCCEDANKKFRQDVGFVKWLFRYKRRLEACMTGCFAGRHQAIFYN